MIFQATDSNIEKAISKEAPETSKERYRNIRMSNAIAEELNLAKTKMIKEINYKGKKLAELTLFNVAIVEAMILNDSAYIRLSNIDAGPDGKKYKGSSAYWMNELKKILIDGQTCDERRYDDVIKGAVEAVDRENSTHINSDKVGRKEIIERIEKIDKEELVRYLRYPEDTNLKLITIISERTDAPQKARTNLSFASKFCHYACFYLFEGTEFQDNYSIYDSILKNALPDYLDYYGIKEKYNLSEYKEYQAAIDAVRTAAGTNISRNGFDHLLWYYHKGRI